MKRADMGRWITALFALGLGCLLLEYDLRHDGLMPLVVGEKKPLSAAAPSEPDIPVIRGDTAVIFEQVYLKSEDMVTGALPEQHTLIGKTLEDIYRFYPKERGYDVKYSDNALTIRQKIDDFSPRQKQKYRLKIYQNLVAVYQGPDREQDILQRVTSIRVSVLPPDVQEKLKNGFYEFDSAEQLQDVLMNFDEWSE